MNKTPSACKPGPGKTVTRCVSLAAAAWMLAHSAWAGASEPHMFAIGSWVCATAEIYDRAMEEQRASGVMALRKRMDETDECLYIDDDAIEDILQPFVTVLDRKDGHAHVTFIIENYRRIAMLHRKFARVEYTGWTSESSVAPR